MSWAARRIRGAIRVTPAADRERYAGEWWADLDGARELGLPAAGVARGAARIAWRLRGRWCGSVLTGHQGAAAATAGWVSVVVVTASVLPFLAWVAVPAAVVVTARAASRTTWRAGHVLMAVLATVWLGSTVSFWWLWGLGFEALDANQPEPAVMVWYGPSFFLGLASFVAFWAAFAVSAHRSRQAMAEPAPA